MFTGSDFQADSQRKNMNMTKINTLNVQNFLKQQRRKQLKRGQVSEILIPITEKKWCNHLKSDELAYS